MCSFDDKESRETVHAWHAEKKQRRNSNPTSRFAWIVAPSSPFAILASWPTGRKNFLDWKFLRSLDGILALTEGQGKKKGDRCRSPFFFRHVQRDGVTELRWQPVLSKVQRQVVRGLSWSGHSHPCSESNHQGKGW